MDAAMSLKMQNEITAAAGAPSPMTNLLGMDRDEIATFLKGIGVGERALKMRSSQLWNWIYQRGARTFDEMSNVSKDLRATLGAHATIERPAIALEQISSDGTRKWLLDLMPDQQTGTSAQIETVYIPDRTRGTLCISSQIGCTLTCSFCHTGTQRLVRNLTAAEILGQIMIARDVLGEWPGAEPANAGSGLSGQRQITNIVVMGMGEPLYNFDNVKRALSIASDNEGLSVSKRRITLSTSGVVPMMARCGEEIGVMLAVSLHAARDDIRDQLVPINRKYPLKDLLDACRAYPGLSNARRITFEYVMLKGINDTPADARELVRLLAGIPAKINLIPFNPWPGAPFACSDWDQIERFAEIINRAGYASPIRSPRGRDIMAACGQLKSESLRLSARERPGADPIKTDL